ncbi:hypothetical protein JKP88DRAFT_176435 [Tribonema minus]|uniref:JmjC domain-containing protein n=1 Tax=Tribonema minus TaxID=303371 RepID=A0A835Z9W9_9STRA|nr:hypothetical protein JKP88DRAFT_176435 [Tribonema minus]
MTPFLDAAQSFTFYCGPPRSGAPFHEHTSAWNACVYGYKRWALLPPCAALTTRAHSSHWLSNGAGEGEGGGPPQGALEFVQGPGEVVFVPPHWTHAVLNLTDVVGVASEFAAHAYPPDLPPPRRKEAPP